MNPKIRQEIIEKLNIDIDKFLDNVRQEQGNGTIEDHDENTIGSFLLGNVHDEIAQEENISRQTIATRLYLYIYPRIGQIMGVKEQSEIAGNWSKILNFLLDPINNYKLNLPLQLNYFEFI